MSYTSSLFCCLSLFVLLASGCGGDDDGPGMAAPDLSARIAGSYDGTLVERLDGNFGGSFNGRAIVNLRAVDATTVRITTGANIDVVLDVTLSDETTFSATDVTYALEPGKTVAGGLFVTGVGTDSLSFTVTDPNPSSAFRVRFDGLRR